MADNENRSFDPSTPEANRTRQQGGGMGARELNAQGDPTRDDYSDIETAGTEEAEGSVEGVQQGRTDTNRAFEDASDDVQGDKTIEANRDIVRGIQDMNP